MPLGAWQGSRSGCVVLDLPHFAVCKHDPTPLVLLISCHFTAAHTQLIDGGAGFPWCGIDTRFGVEAGVEGDTTMGSFVPTFPDACSLVKGILPG